MARPREENADRDVIALFSFLVDAYREDAARVFSGLNNEKTKVNAHKSQRLERKKKLLTLRVAKHWHRCPEMLLHTLKLSKT